MNYAPYIKTARMLVARDALNNGSVELLGPAGAILCSHPLNSVSGTVSADLLTLAGFPKSVQTLLGSSWGSKVTAARGRSSSQVDVITELSVGLLPSVAPDWVASTSYPTVDSTHTRGTEQYRVVTPGTSAVSGGPTGQGASITDGTVVWAWVCPASADVQLSTMQWAGGDTLTIQSGPTFQHA